MSLYIYLVVGLEHHNLIVAIRAIPKNRRAIDAFTHFHSDDFFNWTYFFIQLAGSLCISWKKRLDSAAVRFVSSSSAAWRARKDALSASVKMPRFFCGALLKVGPF